MFNIGLPELILIFVVGLIIFGPKKLPEIGKSIGLGMREFRRAVNDIKQSVDIEGELKRSVNIDPNPVGTADPIHQQTSDPEAAIERTSQDQHSLQ